MSGVLPVTTELSVPWGDLDALGHVNNAVYARWLEQARIAHCERVGLIGGGTVGPILARQAIDLVEPVTYPDRIAVPVGVLRIGRTALTLDYTATSRAKHGAVVMKAQSVIVVFDYAAETKTPVSTELRLGFRSFAPRACRRALPSSRLLSRRTRGAPGESSHRIAICSCQDRGSRVSARIEDLACTTPTAS